MILNTPYFVYKGIDSRMMGIIVTAMPPTVRAAQRVESYKVPGRDGALHESDGCYENYTKTMECAIKNREKIDEIAAWLTGSGDIIFSTEPDKVYKVTIVNTISISQMMRTFQRFQISFDTQPFKYNVNKFDDILTLTDDATILHRGTVYSRPVFTIYGTGAVTLNVNGNDYPISKIDDHIVVDSEMEECYRSNSNKNSRYSAEDFPLFMPGENTVSWIGDVERVEIQPNWRWL